MTLAQAAAFSGGGCGDIPAALAEFLGEAPSEAALRRPGTAASQVRPPSSAANRNPEDSSPDSEGLPPENDGGFDDFRDDAPVPAIPEAEAYAAKGAATAGRERVMASPRRQPVPQSSSGETKVTSSKKPMVPRAPAEASASKSFASTCTPGPAALSSMLGEVPAAAAMRKSSGSVVPTAGDTASSLASSLRSQASSHGRSNSFHNSGSRQGRDRSNTPKGASAVLDLDPLGATSRRRFGGRG
mmetsp:Transcript_71012/g.170132  ORF Transcript_71012/g.170132 Transcript_71012/m.170132 type:complete len:243 (+) Transcript_71012:31-759(+)